MILFIKVQKRIIQWVECTKSRTSMLLFNIMKNLLWIIYTYKYIFFIFISTDSSFCMQKWIDALDTITIFVCRLSLAKSPGDDRCKRLRRRVSLPEGPLMSRLETTSLERILHRLYNKCLFDITKKYSNEFDRLFSIVSLSQNCWNHTVFLSNQTDKSRYLNLKASRC